MSPMLHDIEQKPKTRLALAPPSCVASQIEREERSDMLWHESNGLQNFLTMLWMHTEKVEVEVFERLAIR